MSIRLKLLLCFISFSMLVLIISSISYHQLKLLNEPLAKNIYQGVEEANIANNKKNLLYDILTQHFFLTNSFENYLNTHDLIYLQRYYEFSELELEMLAAANFINPEII